VFDSAAGLWPVEVTDLLEPDDLHQALEEALLHGRLAVVASLEAERKERRASSGTDFEAAVECGHFDTVRRLLDEGKDPSRGMLAAATSGVANPTLRLLLERGANPDVLEFEGSTPLLVAAGRYGSYEAVRTLLQAGADVHHRCHDGYTPLMWSAYTRDWGHPSEPVLDALLDAGSDPNASTSSGWEGPTTVLIGAVQRGFAMNVRTLLRLGADPNLPAPDGRTPLMVAAENGHTLIMGDLLEHGADPAATSPQGETARSLAERHCKEVLGLLGAAARQRLSNRRVDPRAQPE